MTNEETESEVLTALFRQKRAEAPPAGVPGDPFVVDTEEKVEWLLRRLACMESERSRVKAQAQAIVGGLDRDIKTLRERFEPDLRAFAQRRIERDGGRRKSVELLQGTLAFRSVPQGLRVCDESEAQRYAATNSMEDAFVSRFNAAAYREIALGRLRGAGEILPGIEIVPEHESFSVRFPKDAKETGEQGE